MIGVSAPSEWAYEIREFFELFKTPWEIFSGQGSYDVVLCAGETVPPTDAPVVLHYRGRSAEIDCDNGVRACPVLPTSREVLWLGTRIPIYGEGLSFEQGSFAKLSWLGGGSVVAIRTSSQGRLLIRVGYDLFAELRHLFHRGQPLEYARVPTVEWHIQILRNLLLLAGVTVAEVPPVPEGHEFTACLTHDVDHPFLRRHFLDHTCAGFLARAIVGSARDVLTRRAPLNRLLRNWGAAARLPLVYLGLARDSWSEFDRYLDIEAGRPSTFFILPRRDHPGRTAHGLAPARRAVPYEPADLAPQVRRILEAGSEVGLHGIDAWLDAAAGREERFRIQEVTGSGQTGTRVHWLYFDEGSFQRLEDAGFVYDSTVGFNQTVGFRAGTLQVYRPPGVAGLLELPLHIMDTAMFYPAYLNLSFSEAGTLMGQLADQAVRFGGVLTVNWHDRSIAPERLWDESYQSLLNDLQSRGAWFATAAQVVSWFRGRRGISFEEICGSDGSATLRVSLPSPSAAPTYRLRIQRPVDGARLGSMEEEPGCSIQEFTLTQECRVPLTRRSTAPA